MIKVCERPMNGLIVMQPKVIKTEDGTTMVTYDEQELRELGIEEVFVQENQSRSAKNVLRGMHFQQEYDQAQIVRVLEGTVYDVVVDVRPNSPTLGKYYGIFLSQDNRKMVYMSKGFAHGFFAVSEQVVMHYKCSEFYHPEDEAGIRFDDAEVGIPWPIKDREELLLSKKDMEYPTLREYILKRTGR